MQNGPLDLLNAKPMYAHYMAREQRVWEKAAATFSDESAIASLDLPERRKPQAIERWYKAKAAHARALQRYNEACDRRTKYLLNKNTSIG